MYMVKKVEAMAPAPLHRSLENREAQELRPLQELERAPQTGEYRRTLG
jgi:hypothetical protein